MTMADAERIRQATAPAVWRVLETLTVEQLEILVAPGATARDLPELSEAQCLALFAPERLGEL